MTSNYPPGCSDGGYREDSSVGVQCPLCGVEWAVRMFYELGGWFFIDDRGGYCPACGTEADPREV